MFKIEAIGNLGADAEIKDANGNKFISFRVAHSDKWTGTDGQDKERTTWIDVIMNDPDSKVFPYLKQGVKVFVRGYGSTRIYSSPKQRQMLAGVTIKAQEVELCGGSSDDVPRQLVDPETAQLLDVTKYYWCNRETKGMKKEDTRELIDKRGNRFKMDYHGFVFPVVDETQESGQ